MAATEPSDYSSIVLLLGNIEGTDKILELPSNFRYEFRPPDDDSGNWKGGQSDKLFGPFLRLTFGEAMWSPEGWVVGSSPDLEKCDLQLAIDNTTAVSGRHLKIDLSPITHCPRVTVLSRNSVQIHINDRTVTLEKGQSLELVVPVTVDLGEVTLKAWRPILTTQEKQRYRRNAEKFSREVMDAIPKFALHLNDIEASTFDLRFGKDNAVYKREQSGYGNTGSSASVMKVRELHSQKIFAAKVPHFKASDPFSTIRQRWELLTAEFRNIIKLHHPHIVQAFEVLTGSQGNDPPWLIMEWIENDLDSIDLDIRDVPTLLLYVSKGVKYVHAKQFTHRDLKPENILVQLRESRLITAKIADFGTTKHDLSGKMRTYAGTSVYMAPEFWEQELAYTNAIDMWSLGVIAMKLLTDWETKSDAWDPRFPPSKTEHTKWIRQNLFPRMKIAPEVYRVLLQGLLAENPEHRWTAVSSEEWLEKNAQAETYGSRKRGQSSLDEEIDGLKEELGRSNQLPVLTIHAGIPSSPSSIPDTEPGSSPRPEPNEWRPLDGRRTTNIRTPNRSFSNTKPGEPPASKSAVTKTLQDRGPSISVNDDPSQRRKRKPTPG